MRKSQLLSVFVVMMFAIVPFVSADFYYESEVTGQPNQEGPQISKNYVSEVGMRIESGQQTGMIINFEKEVYYQLNFAEKVYTEMPFAELFKPREGEEQAMAQMDGMMKQMMDSMQVQKTEEKKKVGDWNCTKYIVTIMGMNSEYWVTQDVKNYDEMGKYIDKYKKAFDKSPVLKSMASAFEMQKKIDGFPIKTINKMMGMEIVSTVKKIKEGKIDKKMFEVPEGFKKGTME